MRAKLPNSEKQVALRHLPGDKEILIFRSQREKKLASFFVPKLLYFEEFAKRD